MSQIRCQRAHPDESEFDSTHDEYDDEFEFDSTHDEYDDEYALDLGGY